MWIYSDNNNKELCHYGIKGMKWGRRRAQKNTTKKLRRTGTKPIIKQVSIPVLNKKYEKYDFSKLDTTDAYNTKGDPKLVKAYKAYVNEYESKFNEILQQNYKDMFGDRPE